MEFEIRYDRESGCMRIRCWGPATVEGGENFFTRMFAHPEWEPGRDILIDQTATDAHEVASADVRRAAESFVRLKERLGGGRCAVVMADDVHFGLARMWELLSADQTGLEIHVFRDVAAAERWLAS